VLSVYSADPAVIEVGSRYLQVAAFSYTITAFYGAVFLLDESEAATSGCRWP